MQNIQASLKGPQILNFSFVLTVRLLILKSPSQSIIPENSSSYSIDVFFNLPWVIQPHDCFFLLKFHYRRAIIHLKNLASYSKCHPNVMGILDTQ